MEEILLIVMFVLAITSKSYAELPPRGNSNNLVQVIMTGDYQCPFTKRGYETINELLKDDHVSFYLTYKNMPLDFHDQALKAAMIAICAEEQNKFWETSDELFKLQNKKIFNEEGFKTLNLDKNILDICLKNNRYQSVIDEDKRYIEKNKIIGTPHFKIIGPHGTKVLPGAYPKEELKKAILEVL